MTAAPRLSTNRTPLLPRLRTRRRREEIDQALADGAAPSSSKELLQRACELQRPDTRRRIADCLRNLIDAAEEPSSTWSAQGIDPPLRGHAVLQARAELEALAEALSSTQPAAVSGIAAAAALVWSALSPVYAAHPCADVATRARHALHALAATPVTETPAPGAAQLPPARC